MCTLTSFDEKKQLKICACTIVLWRHAFRRLTFQPEWVSFNTAGTQRGHGECKCGLYILILFCTSVRCHNNLSVHMALLLYIEMY